MNHHGNEVVMIMMMKSDDLDGDGGFDDVVCDDAGRYG